MSEQPQPWYGPTGLSELADPGQLLWWLLEQQLGEMQAVLDDLELPKAARRRLQRLVFVHARERATLAGYPYPPQRAEQDQQQDQQRG